MDKTIRLALISILSFGFAHFAWAAKRVADPTALCDQRLRDKNAAAQAQNSALHATAPQAADAPVSPNALQLLNLIESGLEKNLITPEDLTAFLSGAFYNPFARHVEDSENVHHLLGFNRAAAAATESDRREFIARLPAKLAAWSKTEEATRVAKAETAEILQPVRIPVPKLRSVNYDHHMFMVGGHIDGRPIAVKPVMMKDGSEADLLFDPTQTDPKQRSIPIRWDSGNGEFSIFIELDGVPYLFRPDEGKLLDLKKREDATARVQLPKCKMPRLGIEAAQVLTVRGGSKLVASYMTGGNNTGRLAETDLTNPKAKLRILEDNVLSSERGLNLSTIDGHLVLSYVTKSKRIRHLDLETEKKFPEFDASEYGRLIAEAGVPVFQAGGRTLAITTYEKEAWDRAGILITDVRTGELIKDLPKSAESYARMGIVEIGGTPYLYLVGDGEVERLNLLTYEVRKHSIGSHERFISSFDYMGSPHLIWGGEGTIVIYDVGADAVISTKVGGYSIDQVMPYTVDGVPFAILDQHQCPPGLARLTSVAAP